jgi:hypothetical protein
MEAFGNVAGAIAMRCRQDDLRAFYQRRFGCPRAGQLL